MLKKILIYLFISFSVFTLFSQNKLIVGKITFEDLKRTDPDYLLKYISLKVGDEWNDAKKEEIKSMLLKMKKLFEEADVTDKKIDDKSVEVVIKVLEKSAFLIIPYFSYSNTRGFIPKAALRYYNVGGYNKYIKSKLEFVPTESLNLSLRYEDPAVFEKDNINYYIDSTFKTSIINYYANVNFIDNNPSNTTIKGISPLGAFSNSGSQRWNKELFYDVDTTFGYEYSIPGLKYRFKPKINFLFKRVQENVDGDNNFVADEIVRQTIIRPKIDFLTSFPIKDTGVSIEPLIYTSYEHYFGKEEFSDEYKRNFYKDYSVLFSEGKFRIGQKLSVPIFIKLASALLTPYVDVVYQKNNSYAYRAYNDYILLDYYDQDFNIRDNLRDSIDYFLGLTFDKSMDIRNTYHRFKVQAEFTQRVFGHFGIQKLVPDGKVKRLDFNEDGVLDHSEKLFDRRPDTETVNYLYYPRFFFQFSYWFDVTFLKSHVFKFRSRIFAKFNDKFEWDKYDLRDDADDLTPGRVKGWAGWFLKFKYEIPLFEVKTPRWVTKSIKRQQKWGVFWDLYLDVGIAQNNEPDYAWVAYDDDDKDKIKFLRKKYPAYTSSLSDDEVSDITDVYYLKTSYTLDKNNLHLYPALAIGTNIRILPKFWPIEIRLTVAGSLWQIIRDKEISGRSVLFEFSIEDAF